MNSCRVTLSIITVNYNDASGLEKTIQYVISQKYPEIEYLVIDGGSTDDSLKIIKKHSDHLAYWVSEPDNGIYQAMNKGITKSTNDYVLFLNSGDEFYSVNSIKQLVESSGNEDFIYGDIVFREKNRDYTNRYPSILTFSYFLKDSLPHPCTLIKRSLFINIGFYNEQFKIVSDWEFFINAICRFNASYKHVSQYITYFNSDGISSKTENQELIQQERNAVLMKHFSCFLPDYIKHQELNLITNSRFIKLMIKLRSLSIIKSLTK